MQVQSAAVLQSIYRAIDTLNRTLPPDRRLDKTPETPLQPALDSIDLVNLVVETEMAIEEDFGQTVNLADEKAASQGTRVYATVGSFAVYIEALLAG